MTNVGRSSGCRVRGLSQEANGELHAHALREDLARLRHGAASGSRSVAEVCEAVRTAAAKTPAGDWVRTSADAEGWHERFLSEGRLPTSAELDAAAPDHPVFLYRRHDAAVLNTRARRQLASWLAERPAGSWDEAAGYLSGLSVRALNDLLYREDKQSTERRLDLLGRASQRLLAMGITSVVDPGLAAGFARAWELFRTARDRRLVAQRIHLMNRLDYRLPFDREMERLRTSPAHPFDSDPRLRAWAVKIILDGEFSDAWMAGGAVADGEPTIRYSEAELDELVALCAERRWPLCVHVMGGGAAHAVVCAVERAVALGLSVLPGRFRLRMRSCSTRRTSSAASTPASPFQSSPYLPTFSPARCSPLGVRKRGGRSRSVDAASRCRCRWRVGRVPV